MAFPSTTLKLVGVALLALAMGVPLLLTAALVGERRGRLAEAESAIAEAQGRAQTLAPPLLVWEEYGRVHPADRLHRVAHHLAPRTARMVATAHVEERQRGIFRVPVYRVELGIEADFAPEAGLRERANPIPGSFRLEWPIEDLRGVRAIGPVVIEGQRLEPEAAATPIVGGERLVLRLAGRDALPERLPVRLTLEVSGTRELWFTPLASATEVRLAGGWPAPSFAGAFLPVAREVRADGFVAQWSVLGVNRRIPAHWSERETLSIPFEASRFGVVLHDPGSIYRLNERSLKYGLLFIGLTFGLAFLAEVLSGRRVHPVQYLLVGASLAVFFVLLLALSEHIGFGPAWWLSALALVAINGAYAASAFGGRRAGFAMAAWLAALYGFLHMMVVSEDHALLIGAIGVLAMVAGAMALTRRIDWYRLDTQRPASAPAAPSVA
jgi:inner membrane protein